MAMDFELNRSRFQTIHWKECRVMNETIEDQLREMAVEAWPYDGSTGSVNEAGRREAALQKAATEIERLRQQRDELAEALSVIEVETMHEWTRDVAHKALTKLATR
jgi:hypothetical protein